MEKPKLLIFDFDGTIVDSKQAYYHAINTHLQDYGFSKKQIDEAIGVGLSLSETLKNLGFSPFIRWIEKRRIMKQVLKHASTIKKCKDVNSIKSLKNYKILVTNSLREFAMPILKHLSLKKDFREIYTADNFDNKQEFISEYLKKRKISPKDVFYIGDRAADIKLAGKIGCKSVIIAGKCAWDSRTTLIKLKPDFLISDVADLKKIL